MNFTGRAPSQIAWVTPDLDATAAAPSARLGARNPVGLPNVHFPPGQRHTRVAGLHHVGSEADDPAAAGAPATDAGAQLVQRGVMPGGMAFGYVTAPAAGVPFIEYVQFSPAIREFFDYLKQEQR